MKKKIIFVINSLWSAIIAFTFPVCLGIIYMNITGHSKGYDYDLGSEKDISILLGIIELIVWLIFAIPSNVYILKRISKATPHKDCAAETQLDFSSDCTEILQAYCRMAKNFCAR